MREFATGAQRRHPRRIDVFDAANREIISAARGRAVERRFDADGKRPRVPVLGSEARQSPPPFLRSPCLDEARQSLPPPHPPVFCLFFFNFAVNFTDLQKIQ